MKIKKNRTSSYVCTINMNNKSDQLVLEGIRQAVKTENRRAGGQSYVKLQGRKPRVGTYRTENPGKSFVSVGNAREADVYIYDRWP